MASSTSWYCHFWCCISDVFYRVKFSYYCDFDWFLTPSSIQALHFLYIRTQNIKSCQRKLYAILNTQNMLFCRSAMIMFFFVMQFQHKHLSYILLSEIAWSSWQNLEDGTVIYHVNTKLTINLVPIDHFHMTSLSHWFS